MSHEIFKVGDVCQIVANDERIPLCDLRAQTYVGSEGVITALAVRFDRFRGVPHHALKMSDGAELNVAEHCLRKQPPPSREQVSTWDDVIVWRPKEIAHV